MSDDDNVVPLVRRGHVTEPIPAHLTHRQKALVLLERYGYYGMTWAELGAEIGVHHGAASGVLSGLHAQDQVVRLRFEVRNGLSVYVLPGHAGNRPVMPRRRASGLTSDMAAMLRQLQRECAHIRRNERPHPTCKWCQVKHLLDRYDRQTRRNGG